MVPWAVMPPTALICLRLTLSGVVVEKLLSAKFAEIELP